MQRSSSTSRRIFDPPRA